MYSKIVKNVNFPFYCFLSGKYTYYRQYRQLEENQWLPPEYLGKLRWKLFTELIEDAYRNTDFYKEVISDMGGFLSHNNIVIGFRYDPLPYVLCLGQAVSSAFDTGEWGLAP